MRILVTGASRGIGLELVRQLAARGDTVEACARRPEEAPALQALAGPRVRLHALDVTSATSVTALAGALADAALDLVYNVAGVFGDRGDRGDVLDTLAADLALFDVAATYEANAIGPLRVALALLPHVRRGAAKKLVHVTSGLGSIADNTSGGYYGYRMSRPRST